jgi:YHS domain-containing protein
MLALAVLLLPAIPAVAYQAKSTAHVNVDKQGIALRGYDPVAYFADRKASLGKAEFTAEHDGAVYRFTSAANRDHFVGAPRSYAPQYGGYCAYAASQGYKADADPHAWHIVDGRLFVNYSAAVARTWAADSTSYIKAGDKTWERVKSLPAR